MLARELVDKYKDKVIKLGFGSGFVYCGKVDETMLDLLTRADIYYLDRAERSKIHANAKRKRAILDLADMPEKIKNMEDELEQLRASLETLKDKLDNETDKELQKVLRADIKSTKEDIKKLEGDKKHEGSINLAKRKMVHLEKMIPYLKRAIEGLEKYIKTYTSFTEREIKEEYHSIDTTDVCPIDMIVVCNGNEDGKYWTVSEYMEDTERPY